MAANITINPKQKGTLKDIVSTGKVDLSTKIDKRTVNALEARGLVKILESKKGRYAAATAAGKKFFN